MVWLFGALDGDEMPIGTVPLQGMGWRMRLDPIGHFAIDESRDRTPTKDDSAACYRPFGNPGSTILPSAYPDALHRDIVKFDDSAN